MLLIICVEVWMDGWMDGWLMEVTIIYITKSIGALTPGSLNGSYCPGPGPPLPKREAEMKSASLPNGLKVDNRN